MRALTHSMFALLWCQEKPSGVYKMQETALAAGAPSLTPLGELTCSAPLDPAADGKGAGCPIPKNPTPSRPFRPRLSPPPNFQTQQGLKNPFLCPDGRVATGEGRLAESLSSLTEQVDQCFDAIVNHLIPLEFYICWLLWRIGSSLL